MKNKLGTNQYKIKQKYKFWPSVIWIVLLCILVAFLGYLGRPQSTEFIYPIPKVQASEPLIVEVAYEDVGDPIISEINKVFAKEGRKTIARAIMCFYSESGLRPDAYNFNSNGTGDFGPAQVNQVHIAKYGDKFLHDWKENLRVAYDLYKKHGWKIWYGKYCN